MAWLSGWSYRKAVTLDPATPQDNYQVKIELTTSNFDYSKANANGDDLRFCQSDGTTLLDYWIESWDTSGTSVIWVEVTPSGTDTIYMYYGNSSAEPASSGENTFDFFDDFDDGDISDWGQTGTPDVVSSQYVSPPYSVYAAGGEAISKAIPTQTGKFITEYQGRYTKTGDTYDYFHFYQGDTRAVLLAFHEDYLKYYDGSYHNVYDTSVNTWYKIKLIVDVGANTYDIYVNDSLETSGAAFENSVTQIDKIYPININSTYPNPGYVDNIIIRKYASSEPSATLGDEAAAATLADTLNLSEVLQPLAGYKASLSDSLNLNESSTQKAGYKASLTDSLNLSETISPIGHFSRAFSDTLNLTDVFRAFFGAYLSDTLSLTDSVSVKAAHLANVSDTLSLSDAISALGKFKVTLNDTLDITDTLKAGLAGKLSDTLTLSDAVSVLAGYIAGISDTLVFTDKTISLILPKGKLTITFTGNKPTITFTGNKPTITFTGNKPTITFTGK